MVCGVEGLDMSFWQVYGYIIAEFLVEYSVFAVLFLHKLNRRKMFWLRAALGFAVLFAIGLPVALFYKSFGNTLWGRILVYLLLFAVFTLLARACFDEKYLNILFCCSMAYAAQNLTYKIYLVIWTTGEQLRLYDNWGEHFNLYYRLMYYSIYYGCVAGEWFIFIRRLTEKFTTKKLNYEMLIITFIVLIVTIVLCSVEDLNFAELSVDRENRFENRTYVALRQAGNYFSILCCCIVLLLASKAIVENELLQEVEYLKYSIRQSEKQYHMSKDTIEAINIKCHDMKYKLAALAAKGGIPSEEIKELYDDISLYDSNTETGNPLLNVLITEKSLYCEQNGINLSCMINGEELGFIEDGDLYCLFGNIIDNAIEAVKGIEEKERRIINLSVKAKDGMLLVQEDNYFNGSRTFKDGLPATTKDDKSSHGFGMRSIKMIVKKYGGEITATTRGDIFCLNILFGGVS